MEKRAEVVVIGGGISGCAIAYNLAKRGAQVVLLEKGQIADEASGRTWGAVRRQGRQAPEVPLAMESLKLWGQLSEELGSETHFIRGGNLLLAGDDKELADFQETVKITKQLGLESDIVDRKRIIEEIVPGIQGTFVGGMYSPSDGYAHPVKTTNAFAQAAQEHGAKIYTRCPVERIETTDGKVRSVVTDKGEIETDTVVNAAGVWAARLARTCGVKIPMRIIRTHVTITEPKPDFTSPLVWTPGVSFRPTVDGNILLGAGGKIPVDHDIDLSSIQDFTLFRKGFFQFRKQIKIHVGRPLLNDIMSRLPGTAIHGRFFASTVGVEPEVNWDSIRKMREAFFEHMPHLRGLRFVKTWAGWIDLTPDIIPILGEVPGVKGLILATGFSGHGFALGPITGRVISELVLDGKPSLPLDDFRLSRFKEKGVAAIRRLQ
ncbi:MAG: FAD-binding oxidoreductase [Dehalococcoidia bacterium]